MMDFDGAVLAPLSADLGQVPTELSPPDEASTLFMAGAVPPDGDAILLSDTAGDGDEWIVPDLVGASPDALAAGLAAPGGWGIPTPLSTEDEEEDIVITGTRWPEADWTGSGYGWSDGSGGSGGTGGGNTGSDTEPKDTPCVETELESGVSTKDANRAALAASKAILEHNNSSTYEYSSIVWTKNGQIGFTVPYTDKQIGDVNLLGGIDGVPDGAVIIGIVHNHPDISGINDAIPSGAGSTEGKDWTGYDAIVSNTVGLPRGITADSNMLLWILNGEDNKTRVYDKTDKNQMTASCSINP